MRIHVMIRSLTLLFEWILDGGGKLFGGMSLKSCRTLCVCSVPCAMREIWGVEQLRAMTADDFLVECHRKVAEDFVVVLRHVWFG